MWRNYRLLFGPLAATLLFLGIVALGLVVPGYSQVRQTVSEIGEVGSPAQIPFAILLVSVSACIVLFAMGVRDISSEAGRSPWPAYVIGFMALSVAGVGVFAYPHPLHGIFGLSELIGYLASLILALTWRRDSRMSPLVGFSWAVTGLVWISIALNLSSLDRHAAVFTLIQPFYGLVQRSLFALWFGWCAVVGVLLFRRHAEFDRKTLSATRVGE
jgi:hypothetical membrane protein